jgi:hypothetical protein
MPEAVARRLNEVIAAESARRTDAWKPKPTLGTFGQNLKSHPSHVGRYQRLRLLHWRLWWALGPT